MEALSPLRSGKRANNYTGKVRRIVRMGRGIVICGLNGGGKSTLGRALAQKLGCAFMDIEDYYFPKQDAGYLYAGVRAREEVERLLARDMEAAEDFVFSAVKGDYGDRTAARLTDAVWICVPKEIRMQRVRARSYQKFGERMLPGGDLYEQEERFFAMIEKRTEQDVEDWLAGVPYRVLRVDGTRPIAENVERITAWLREKETKEE